MPRHGQDVQSFGEVHHLRDRCLVDFLNHVALCNIYNIMAPPRYRSLQEVGSVAQRWMCQACMRTRRRPQLRTHQSRHLQTSQKPRQHAQPSMAQMRQRFDSKNTNTLCVEPVKQMIENGDQEIPMHGDTLTLSDSTPSPSSSAQSRSHTAVCPSTRPSANRLAGAANRSSRLPTQVPKPTKTSPPGLHL